MIYNATRMEIKMSRFTKDINKLRQIVSKCTNFKQVFELYDIKGTPSVYYTTLKKDCKDHNISIAHFNPNITRNEALRSNAASVKIPIEKILDNTHYFQSNKLKKRLFEEGLKMNMCEECGLGDIWNGKNITHQLDHIDGNNLNNSLNNLRILCPNCHTQTSTHSKSRSKKWS